MGSAGSSRPIEALAPLVLAVRPSVEAHLRISRRVGDFAEDLTSEAVLIALSNPSRFDLSTGVEGFRRYLTGIADNLARRASASSAREATAAEQEAENRRTRERDAAARKAIAAEARERLELMRPHLSPLEVQAMEGWIEGKTDRATAKALGISRRVVCRARLNAMEKCRRPRVVGRADLNAHMMRACNWEGGTKVTIYHPPPKLGAMLDREKLAKLK